MPHETIRYELDDSILTITLNRPDKLNAFTTQMLHEMIDAFDRADKDDAYLSVNGRCVGECRRLRVSRRSLRYASWVQGIARERHESSYDTRARPGLRGEVSARQHRRRPSPQNSSSSRERHRNAVRVSTFELSVPR
jgi:hypothetical protein